MSVGNGPVGDAETCARLRRQLELRSAEVARLRSEIAALSGRPGYSPVVAEWRAKAAEYDALMATKTMHALRIPRVVYGRLVARSRAE